ncbi:MAG: MmgE/PrpD family protein [Deltaproteobacteria bacterium]|nr:MmgE/PrpD family protein [Deltaproteobacteria bacterium]
MTTPTLSSRLSSFFSRLSYSDLSESQITKLKLYFLDWLGSAIAGRGQKPVRIILELIRDMGGNPESTVIADQSRSSCLWAALVNGASSHMVEMDDLHRESILHPAAAIMPAVFALAEREKADGKDLLSAIAVGYEAAIRIAVVVGPSHYRFWHTTGTCGTFGAAAGAARLLGLNEEQTVSAFGSAGTQAGGLWEFLTNNAMSKQLHPGKAAFNGLLSALLAQKGFTGAGKILEGEKGFFKATSQDFDESRCLKGLGTEWMFERNSIKYHASCGHTHSAIDAVLQATRGLTFDPADIEEVSVLVYQGSLDLLSNIEPSTPYLAKFNMPFCLASALIYGHADLEDFSFERIGDSKMIGMMQKIRVQADPKLSAMYPRKWPARVEIAKRSGERLTGSIDYPKGDPENPLGEPEVVAKFKMLTKGLITETRADKLCGRVLSLNEVTDVSALLNP